MFMGNRDKGYLLIQGQEFFPKSKNEENTNKNHMLVFFLYDFTIYLADSCLKQVKQTVVGGPSKSRFCTVNG